MSGYFSRRTVVRKGMAAGTISHTVLGFSKLWSRSESDTASTAFSFARLR
jgi:hypothetical protein